MKRSFSTMDRKDHHFFMDYDFLGPRADDNETPTEHLQWLVSCRLDDLYFPDYLDLSFKDLGECNECIEFYEAINGYVHPPDEITVEEATMKVECYKHHCDHLDVEKQLHLCSYHATVQHIRNKRESRKLEDYLVERILADCKKMDDLSALI